MAKAKIELVDAIRIKRTNCITSTESFVNAVISYIRDFRVEHYVEIVKPKKEIIYGHALRYIHYKDGRTVKSYGNGFIISIVNTCINELRLIVEYTNDKDAPHIYNLSPCNTKTYKEVEELIKGLCNDGSTFYPYIEGTMDIDVKVYDDIY